MFEGFNTTRLRSRIYACFSGVSKGFIFPKEKTDNAYGLLVGI